MNDIAIAGGTKIGEVTILVFVQSKDSNHLGFGVFLAFNDKKVVDRYESELSASPLNLSYSDSLFRFYENGHFIYFSNVEKKVY